MSVRPPENRRHDDDSCRTFRELLEAAMRSWVDGRPATGELSWHRHLVDCSDCRALFAEEHALDELLALWQHDPEAEIPPGTARRMLERLRSARGVVAQDTLDRLLDLSQAPAPPTGLSERVLAGLDDERAEARLENLLGRVPDPEVPADLGARLLADLAEERVDARLDRLLDRVPAPEVPAGLTTRVLGALREARVESLPVRELHPVPNRESSREPAWNVRRFGVALAAAAALLVAFLLWKASDGFGVDRTEVARVEPVTPDTPRERNPQRAGSQELEPAGPGSEPEVAVAPNDPSEAPEDTPAPDEPVPQDAAPSEELLLALDVLERWDDVTDSDLDVLLAAVDLTDEDYLIDGAFEGTFDDVRTDGGDAR